MKILSLIVVLKDYLSTHPQVGAFSGVGSGVFLVVSSFFTDEAVIKAIGITGVWLGFGIACLTIIAKAFDVIKQAINLFRKRS